MASEEGAYPIGDPAAVSAKMLEADAVLGGLSRITLNRTGIAGGPNS
ncbi:hypothetical protein [Novosphingobium guangzhouense]|nr:hypothetical protein [Novosphingobium guangzhouense]